MARFHPNSPELSPEELARLKFLATFRQHLHSVDGPANAALYQARKGNAAAADPSLDIETRCESVRETMEAQPFFQAWSALLQSSQDLMWHYVGAVVDPQLERLEADYDAVAAVSGPIVSNPDIELPAYLTGADTHRMPGSYLHASHDRDVRAGAVYDLGSVIYQMGIGNSSGRLLNDSRGRAIASHLLGHYPGFSPETILDMGCGAGNNTLPLCDAFPEARVVGIDIGAALLRYAAVRSAGLGRRVEYRQENAEATNFESGSFDLVVSQIVLHETSPAAMANIFREAARLLRPGGIAVHLEVPLRFDGQDAFHEFFRSWEHYYNGEANIQGFARADLLALAREAGLQDVIVGFQPIPGPGERAPMTLVEAPQKSAGRFWYVVSGKRPA